MPNFTPGPWNSHSSYGPIDAETSRVGTTSHGDGFDYLTISIAKGDMRIGTADWDNSTNGGFPMVPSVEECRANAWLMIASPDQNAALELVLPFLVEEQQVLERSYFPVPDEQESAGLERIALLIKVVSEALSKADGKQAPDAL